jgi:hypothetical protein
VQTNASKGRGDENPSGLGFAFSLLSSWSGNELEISFHVAIYCMLRFSLSLKALQMQAGILDFFSFARVLMLAKNESNA